MMHNWPWPGISPEISARSLSVNDLEVHILEAWPPCPPPFDSESQSPPPLVLLLHGFPELGYSWRKVIVPLSRAGYHVVAPDQRGYGLTTTRSYDSDVSESERPRCIRYDDDLSPFRMLNLVKDTVSLVYALGYTSAAAVVGHDFGSIVAGFSALIRPDIFKSVVMMSAPFTGAPILASDTPAPSRSLLSSVIEQLTLLDPPRKHYVSYYCTPEANTDMHKPPNSLHSFLRDYYHVKSADWPGNRPHRLSSTSASDFAVIPHYYIMPLHQTMPECVSPDSPSTEEIAQCQWLTEPELALYTAQYTLTGFQGGLNWYRGMVDSKWTNELMVFSGKKIEVPAMFVAGEKDWGVFQSPGALEAMRTVCNQMKDDDVVFVKNAGHWVQQEKAGVVADSLVRFLGDTVRGYLGHAIVCS